MTGRGLLLGLAVTLAAAPAAAFTVTVDGSPAEWAAPAPTNRNLGYVARSAALAGAWIWTDAAADERTDFAAPDPGLDLRRVEVTSDATGLYFLVTFTDLVTAAGEGATQVQIAIDTDRVASSGTEHFAGFADTTTSASARWEYLVQTTFGSAPGTARVWAPAFAGSTPVVAASSTADEAIEIAVPWTALGLTGAPAAPLRFTFAAFRANTSDNTYDLGGATVSNAIDVVSSYGDPSPNAAPLPNTFVEVMDQVVDHFADVWFAPEPSSPLLISEWLANAVGTEPNGEFLELLNATAAPLDAGGWRVGDEESLDGAEGMVRLPAGTIIPAGGVLVIAVRGDTFRTLYGFDPSLEIVETSPAIPNTTPETLWATGTVNLANGGDEILVVDPSFTVSDMATHGTATYPGFAGMVPAAPEASSVHRQPIGRDTNSSSDFVVTATPTPGCATTCADDGNECTTDACNPATGTCGIAVAAGTACTDATPGDCDDARCDGVGACMQAFAPEMTGYVCRPAAGLCDIADACGGPGGACPADAREAASVVCRAPAGLCDVAEMCDGTSVSCPADGVATAATTCRVSMGGCDPAELCDGMATACPPDVIAGAGTECRASGGDCDPAEQCDGSAVACPPDARSSAGTICRASAGMCDPPEQCDGTAAACPSDAREPAMTPCRPATGTCDVAEACTGADPGCPPDLRRPAGFECRGASGLCDVAETCNGTSGVCPGNAFVAAGTVCRAAAGVCDVGETCSGVAAACPPDARAGAGVVCRAAGGTCDLAESCDGTSTACPPNAFVAAGTECRAAAGMCDVAESCSGSTGACPANATAPDMSACDDVDACTGGDFCSSGVCRPGRTDLCVDAGPPDAGPIDAGPPDAGPPDAGPLPDAGPMDEDAGLGEDAGVEADAGLVEDAGPPPPDAGPMMVDAGPRRDAGRAGFPPGRGDDGCGCSLPGRDPHTPFGLLILGLALVAVRIRSSRGRGAAARR